MQIPSFPDYNGLLFSGCSMDFIDGIEDGRIYGPVLEYEVLVIPVLATFNFIVHKEWGRMHNYPIIHKLQHLSSDALIDYQSFHSLN